MEQFDISTLGFLPDKCWYSLPERFSFLNEIIINLPENVSGDKFREYIEILPEYDIRLHSTSDLTLAECKYIYSVFCMIMNRYIWCTGVNNAKYYCNIPKIIGIPLYEVSKRLGIALVLTHAAVDLWNWQIPEGKEFSLDNLIIINTMTGNESESWFYKVMIAIEGNGGKMLPEILEISDNNQNIKDFLVRLDKNMEESIKLIKRMYEHCDPDFFFNHIRIYLSGSRNDNLQQGVTIDLSPLGKEILNLNHAGGSAAQSTLIQVYDKLLGVEHNDTEDIKTKEFLLDMRRYMPKAHREFLDKIITIKPNANDELLKIAHGKCLTQLERFRRAHLGLVQNYVVKFMNSKSGNNNAHGNKGSGGTDPEKFCEQIIRETHNTKI